LTLTSTTPLLPSERHCQRLGGRGTGANHFVAVARRQDQAVRGSAASYLLRNGAAHEAEAVLEELAGRDDLGRVTLDADGVLLAWEKEQTRR
jgi:hypothetical protein